MYVCSNGLNLLHAVIYENIHGFTPTETGLFMTVRGVTSFIFAAAGGIIVAKLKDFRLVAIAAMVIFGSMIFALTFFTTSATSLAITVICLIWERRVAF